MKYIHKVIEIARHRNGVGGAPFYAVLFEHWSGKERMVGIVHDEPGYCSVVSLYRALDSDKGVGVGINSWRGDLFEPELRAAVEAWEAQRSPEPERDREAMREAASEERFNTRFENLPEQGGGR